MFKVIFALVFIMLFSPRLGFATPAVLIEEGNKSDISGWKTMEKPVSEGKSIIKMYEEQEFEDAFALRAKRRVGVGLSLEGQAGFYGSLIELNFTPEDSAVTGFGGGSQYSSFSLQWKHVFGGSVVTPYSAFGFNRWFSLSGNAKSIGKTNPPFLGSKFLTAEEKATGRFEKNLISPAVGLQYYQLDGPYKGLGVFVELVLLMEVADLAPVATGGIGTLYYF
jgi:hypothetical protein